VLAIGWYSGSWGDCLILNEGIDRSLEHPDSATYFDKFKVFSAESPITNGSNAHIKLLGCVAKGYQLTHSVFLFLAMNSETACMLCRDMLYYQQ
jgi:hypothetical protein